MAKYMKTEDGYQEIEVINSNKMDKDNPVGTGSFSMGRKVGSVVGNFSHAEGSNTTASGNCSHAEGSNTTASGNCSHAEGVSTTASGNCSHAEGVSTTASGNFSHAEGGDTTASGSFSHAEGKHTTASGDYSHAEGYMTTAASFYQHVQGKRNIEDLNNKYAHIVGNGENDDVRSNAHTLDWNGNAWFAGDVYVGSTSGTNKDDGSKKLATVDECVQIITTEGDGAAYTATVPGITSLTAGVSFIMIPHVVSTSTIPTLNVNGFGAKNIKRRLTSLATAAQPGYTAAWLAKGLPFRVIYDGTQWIAEGHDKPAGADLYGAAAKATADADGNVITDTYATIAALQDMLPKISTITLGTTWEGTGPYYQDVALSFVTEEYIVDLQPSVEQIVSWQESGYAFTTLSGTGSVRIYAIGNLPSESISIQIKAQKVMLVP